MKGAARTALDAVKGGSRPTPWGKKELLRRERGRSLLHGKGRDEGLNRIHGEGTF